MSLGRLLGAGRGAPIIVAGDRSETSPSNPSSPARKSCHRGSLAAPRASHPVCQHPSWGTESRGPSRPKDLRTFGIESPEDTAHLPLKIEYLTVSIWQI